MRRLILAMLLVMVTCVVPASALDFYQIVQAHCQELSISGISAATENAVKANQIIMFSTADCYVKLGSAPTATASGTGNIFLPANTFVGTSVAQNDKVAAITGGATGKLYVYSLR